MLTDLRAIRFSGVATNEILYAWDDWVEQPTKALDKELHASLKVLSNRACAALSIACAEWIVARYSQLIDVTLAKEWLESSWALMVDAAYACKNWEGDVPEADWPGSLRRPVWRSLAFGAACVSETDPSLVAYCACMVVQIARYVLPSRDSFDPWYFGTYQRLVALYPLDLIDPIGDVVPRQAFDLDVPFNINDTEPLVTKFLEELKAARNPFVCSPEQMLMEGFEGTPFQFDLAKDRAARSGPSF